MVKVERSRRDVIENKLLTAPGSSQTVAALFPFDDLALVVYALQRRSSEQAQQLAQDMCSLGVAAFGAKFLTAVAAFDLFD